MVGFEETANVLCRKHDNYSKVSRVRRGSCSHREHLTCYGTACMKVRPFCRAWSVPPKPSLIVPMLERPQPETPRDGTNPTYP